MGQDRRRRAPDGHDGRLPGGPRPGRPRRSAGLRPRPRRRRRAPAPAPVGYGPYFGAVPDFGDAPHPGVRLGGVRPGSPARPRRPPDRRRHRALRRRRPSGRSTTSCSPCGAAAPGDRRRGRLPPRRDASGPCRPRSRSGGERRGRGADGRRVLAQLARPPRGAAARPRRRRGRRCASTYGPAGARPGRRAPRPRRPARAPPRRPPPAHLRRPERRGLLGSQRHPAGLPVDAAALRLRPDLHHGRRRERRAARVHRPGTHDVRASSPGRRRGSSTPRPTTPAADCPPRADRSRGYVWPLYDYDLYTCAADGSDLRRLTTSPGYDAEGTIAPDGRIVFTSMRDGDLDLYVMDADGGSVRRLTDRPGYDGGPFFSWDGRDIVWRGWHPTDPGELAEYRALLGQGLVRPTRAELFVMARRRHRGAPGHVERSGELGAVPPSRRRADRLLVEPPRPGPASTSRSTSSGATGAASSALTLRGVVRRRSRCSLADGRRLVFCSSRGAAQPREFNVFVADWVD